MNLDLTQVPLVCYISNTSQTPVSKLGITRDKQIEPFSFHILCCRNKITCINKKLNLAFIAYIAYHFLGTVSGLYFLYFILHSIISLQRIQTPLTSRLLIILIFIVLSWRSFLKTTLFWCFCGRLLCTFPLWLLIFYK